MSLQSKFIVIFLTFLVNFGLAQTAKLSGKITDEQTGEPLISATIRLGEKGTITDFNGAYEIEAPAGELELEISYVGYEILKDKITLAENEAKVLDFTLKESVTILNTATVTTGKYEKPLGEVTVSLEILKPNLIENTSKTRIDAALEKVPGVTIVDGSANIRAGSGYSQGAGSRVLLLVDDVPILQADAGFPNWDDVPIEIIEQVEVLKGSASALYGTSALNGIVNIRTAYAKSKPETKGSFLYTTMLNPSDERLKWWDSAPNTFGGTFSHKQKFDKFDLVLGGFYLNEESHLMDTDKERGRFTLGTRYRINDRLSFGINANFNKGTSNSYFYWRTETFDGEQIPSYKGTESNITTNKRTRFNIDPFITYFDKGGNRHKFLGRFYSVDNDNGLNQSNASHSFYGEYQFQRKFEGGLVLTAGLVGLSSKVEAELYGDTTFTSRNFAGYLQLDKKFFERLNVSAGFRYERNVLKNPGFGYTDPIRGNVQVTPSDETDAKPVFRVGLNYKAGEGTFLRASWGQGYRYPTVAERYIVTNVGFPVLPNPNLEFETGWSGELGVKQGFKISNFEGFIDLAAYIFRYENMIEFNLVGFGFSAVNIGDTEIKGYEVTVAGRGKLFGLPTSILTGYTYANPRYEEFDTTPIGPDGIATEGQINANNSSSEENILKYRFEHTFKFDIETEIKNFSVGIAAFYNSYMRAIDNAFLLIVPGLDQYRKDNPNGFTVINARTSYKLGEHLKFSLILNNVFNEHFATRPGLFDAPRNLTARVDYKF